MSAPRLAAGMLVSALMRRVQAAGGFAAVLHRGDAGAGAILIETRDAQGAGVLLERASDMDGNEQWRIAGAADEAADARADRLQRRLKGDPDLWIIELDIAEAERFAAETIAGG